MSENMIMFMIFIIPSIVLTIGLILASNASAEREEKRRILEEKLAEEKKVKEEKKKAKAKDYDPMIHIACMEQEFGIKFTNIPGTASKKTQESIKSFSKAIDDAINAEKKMKELKEKQEKVLQRKKELEQLINDRMGEQITMDEWEKEINKQNIIKEIKEQKEKEALNNGGIQMSLFKEEDEIITDKEIENYRHKKIMNFIKDTEEFLKECEEKDKEYKERDKREAEEFMRNYINKNLPRQNSDILKDLYKRKMETYKSKYPKLYWELELESLDI